jgi:hypothetical protein
MSNPKTNNPLLEAALAYGARGWRVVPNRPRDKVPTNPWTGSPLPNWQEVASAHPDQIRRWWGEREDLNCGVQLGHRSGLIDLECDTAEAEAALVELLGRELAGAVPQFRGKRGLHRLFKWSPGFPDDKAVIHWRGVEFRLGGDLGAQSIFPPSVHPDGPTYQWVVEVNGEPLVPLPPAVVEKVVAEASAAAGNTGVPGADQADMLGPGQRHPFLLREAARLRAMGYSPEEIYATLQALNGRRCKPPKSDKELEAIANWVGEKEEGTGGYGLSPPTFTRGSKKAAQAGPMLPPPTDFPTEALPATMAEFVTQTAHAIGCPTPFVALPALAAVFGSIGNTRRVMLKKDWTEPAVGWFALLGESGDLKSPAQRAALRFLHRDEARLARENRESQRDYEWARDRHRKQWAEALKEEGAKMPEGPQRPSRVRALIDDVTIEKVAQLLSENPRGLLLARDELSGWIGSMTRYAGKDTASSDLPRWLSIYDADPILVDRKGGDMPSIHVPAAAVSLVGGIQPGVWRRVMGVVHYESGLIARLLLAWQEADPKGWSDAEAPAACVEAYEGLLGKLRGIDPCVDANGAPTPFVIKLTPEARVVWVQFFNAWAERMAASDGAQRAMLSKLKGSCARLALVHHVAGRVAAGQDDCDPIEPASVNAAVTLTRWFADQAERVYAVLGQDEAARLRDRLADFVHRRGRSITPRNLHRANRGRYPTVAAAEAAPDVLVREGRGAWLVTTGGGRPSKVFHLAPEPPADPGEEGGDDA